MDIKIDNPINKNKNVSCGDIILSEDGMAYIITDNIIYDKEGLNGVCLDGCYWMSKPQEYIDTKKGVLYKKDEWELVLKHKVIN